MNINQAAALTRIAERAERITEDYRLLWDRREEAFKVAHKTDRARRYKVTVETCSCPSFADNRTCKHHQGLADLATVEVNRYALLGFADDLRRVQSFLGEIEVAPYAEELARRENAESETYGCDPFAEF